jgi:uncharacterized protein YndB with AHSA1/START domain
LRYDEQMSDLERHVQLDVPTTELWRLISTADGWRSWLADDVDGELGDQPVRVTDADVVRTVRIGEVLERQQISFTWWEDDDPTSVSHVTLEIVDDGGVPALRITERGAINPESRAAWEVRLCSLWACTVAAALV